MTVLIIGRPGSGKSVLAEQTALELSGEKSRIYLATMIPFGDEGKARIEKHRRMREGKGFETIEAAFDVSSALADRDLAHMTVLLECLSNLTANELFERHTDFNTAIDRICADVTELACRAENLVIVSNHFDISDDFDTDTKVYARTMDLINERLSVLADKVIRL